MSVRAAINRVAYISGAVGLTPSSGCPPYRPQTGRIVYQIFLLILLTILLVIQVYFYETEETLVDTIGNALWAVMNPLGYIFAIISSLIYRKNYEKLLGSLVENLDHFEGKIVGKRLKISLKFYTIPMVIVWAFWMAINIEPWQLSINVFAEEVGLLFLFVAIYHSSGILLIIRFLLQQLHAHFTKTFDENIDSFVVILKKEKPVKVSDTIFNLKKFYHNIFQICLDLNDLFALVNVWLLIHLTAMVIASGYHILQLAQYYFAGNALHTWLCWREIFGSFRWFSIGVISMGFWIWPYTQVSKQCKIIQRAVNGKMIGQVNRQTSKELQSFLSLLQQEEISFSPYGLFEFSNCLVPKITSAAVTYLVLLTQMPKTITKTWK